MGRRPPLRNAAAMTTTATQPITTPRATSSTSPASGLLIGQALYALGEPVSCVDGDAMRLSAIVIDPAHRTVTTASRGWCRSALVDAAPGSVRLRCTLKRWRELPDAQTIEIVGVWPPYPMPTDSLSSYGPTTTLIERDCVPAGEVEVHERERLHAMNGATGRIDGLIVNRADQRVTQVLLREGYLWNRRDVLVALDQRDHIDEDGVHVSVTKHDLAALRPLPARKRAFVA